MNQPETNDLLSRRTIVKSAILGGAAAAMPGSAIAQQLPNPQEAIKSDKECIMEAGLTEAEADCWAKTAEAAGLFFKLPQLHPEDAAEVTVAIHVIQQKLLARPTYRKYLKIAKSNHERKQSVPDGLL